MENPGCWCFEHMFDTTLSGGSRQTDRCNDGGVGVAADRRRARLERNAPLDLAALTSRLVQAAIEGGAVAVGVTPAEVWPPARDAFVSAIRKGLAADVSMTYRNWRRATDPSDAVPSARVLLVGAWPTRRRPPVEQAASSEHPAVIGRVARYAWSDPYPVVRGALRRVAGDLKSLGFRARVLSDDNALGDRAAAIAAGLGWRGKSGNVLVPGWGPHVVLGSVVTDADLVISGQPPEGSCGTCTRCVRWCPTGALAGDGSLDAGKCLAWIVQRSGSIPVEYRAPMGDRMYGCDECSDACPPDIAPQWGPPDQRDRPTVDALALLELGDADVLQAVDGWYVPGRDPDAVRRNAAVVVGNTASNDNRRAHEALRHSIESGGAVVRAHALWAAARLGHADLVAWGLAREDDPAVVADVAQWRTAPAVCGEFQPGC